MSRDAAGTSACATLFSTKLVQHRLISGGDPFTLIPAVENSPGWFDELLS
jgi:hypothetical protein